jgi:uncharacterized protein (TIGR02145 family)
MRTQLTKITLAAGIALAITFTFNACGGDSPNDPGGNSGNTDGNTDGDKCGGEEYDTSSQFCSNNTVYSKCDGKEYNPTTQFCSSNTVYSKCGGSNYSPLTQFCSSNKIYSKCGGKEYNPTTQECTNNVIISFFTDSRDNKKYKTVVIGTQTWMAENLNNNATNSKCFSGLQTNCDKYGRLYDWATAMAFNATCNTSSGCTVSVNHRGICPSGWHIPSDAEWTQLVNFVGGSSAGAKLKAKSNDWTPNDGTDNYGFSALTGNYLNAAGNFSSITPVAYWWSSTENSSTKVWPREILSTSSIMRVVEDKTYFLSVRCVKN